MGKARFEIDGKQVIDLWTDHPPNSDDAACFNELYMERFADVEFEDGKKYELAITLTNETFKPPTGTMPPSLEGQPKSLKLQVQPRTLHC